jgi:hypothetical protein
MSELPTGWVTIRGTSLAQRLRAGAGSPTAGAFFGWMIVVQVLIQLGMRSALDEFGWLGVIAIVVFAAAALCAVVLLAPANRLPAVNLDEGLLRVGRRSIAFEAITDATFFALARRGGTESYLYLGDGAKTTATVCVRSTRGPSMDDHDRQLVAEVLRRSSARLPEPKHDPYDPHGRFAWMDHANRLDRDEAIEYVLHTPESGEPVRTPARPKSIWIDED